jgi:hypothetical protein
MGYESVFKLLGEIAAADGLTYGIVAALTLAAFVLLHAMLPAKGLAYVFAPVLFWGGLTGIYTATAAGLVFSAEKAVNSAMFGTVGMTGALVVMVLLTRLAQATLRIRTPLAYADPAPVGRRLRV